MRPHTILIADDHEVVRRGVRTILESCREWKVVGEAASGQAAIEQARSLKPEIVILDIGMPDFNGLIAAREILRTHPATQVLVLTMHESREIVREVLKVGARGYLLKTDAGRDLLTALRSVIDGRPYFTSKVAEYVLEEFRRKTAEPPNDGRPDALTEREREILQLLPEGKSSKQIAALLNLSVKTVEAHRANIMRKLNVHSVGELVRHAIRMKLVSP